MQKLFSISETAKIVGLTTETLRHYDRINLVKPFKTDQWTGYRYYSRQEIVRLNTIRALRCMDLTLSEIKDILEYDDFNEIVKALIHAEQCADNKIAELNYAKAKIQRARIFYENKLSSKPQSGIFVKQYPKRAVLLSDTMEQPTLDNLWNYHRHFYHQIPDNMNNDFSFEDSAGIYTAGGRSQLFVVCTRYKQINGLQFLPQGNYLCADCTEENRKDLTEHLCEIARQQYKVTPAFTVHLIVLSGILRWNYQAQVFISK